MKKAKRLLAVLLAVVMIASAACLPVYAKVNDSSYYTIPTGMTNNGKYYFDAEKGCCYILDMIDEMLLEAYMVIDVKGINSLLATALGKDELNFTSIDNLVNDLYYLIDKVDSGALGLLADWIIGDLTRKENLRLGSLDDSIDRGTRAANFRDGYSDLAVLYNVLGWLNSNTWVLQQIIAGTMDFGVLNDTIYGLEIAGITLLDDPDEGIKKLLYNLLINSTTTEVPAGMTIDDMVQQLINWALIDGTGESAENGGFSMLGMNHKALMPVLKDANKYPGQANIRGVELKTDSNGDGVADTIIDRNNDGVADKMDVYQLVNNLINGLLNGILAPELGGMIADLVGVEITDQYPGGDPAILTDVMFSTILGAVEGLLVQNGADPVVYSEEQGKETPMGKINDLVNWLFNGSNGGKPALYTFINIDYYGIGLTDNFMSLLNDLVRLAINLLPALGIELPENSGLPSADELTESNWYKVNEDGTKVICSEGDEGAVDQLYMTYTGERPCFATYTDDSKKVVDYYTYFDDNMPVNTADPNASGYENADFIRPYYKIPMDNVWAALLKMVFGMIVEGPYFPEWATDMPSVLAYGCAGLAVSILPEENFYKRLDAYHHNHYLPGEYTYPEDTAPTQVIPYSDSNTTRSVSALPTGAMNILSSVAAYYLNTMLNLTSAEKFETHDTSFEQLLTELGLWAFIEYIPILAGELDSTGDKVYESSWTDKSGVVHPAGTYAAQTNDLIEVIYEDFSDKKLLAEPNFDAIYTYLDNTILTLIPDTWLPDMFSSSRAIFNDWLFGNLMEFDLQGILSLLSANPDGELGQPLLTVLIRVIDRVLAIVLGGNAVLQPTDRSGTGSNSVFVRNTDITTLQALIEDGDGARGDREVAKTAPLPVLIERIISLIYSYRAPIFNTLLPLIVSQSFERPFDRDATGNDPSFVNVLGNDMTAYKIHHLEDQLDYLTKNLNADFYGEYDTEEKAEAAVESLGNAYIETIEVTPATETKEAVYKYNVYTKRSYLESATPVPSSDDGGDYNVYSNFGYKSVINSSTSQPLAKWDERPYYFSSIEDNNPNGYYYSNYQDALEEADAFVDSYYGFVENDLSNAFGDWLMYSIEAWLVSKDLYDANDDGKAVLSDTDGDYAAPSTNTDGTENPGYPVDGYPSPPESMYPYYPKNDAQSITWIDKKVDNYVTQSRASFNFTNYELLTMADEFGKDPANYVELSLKDTENVVRFCLDTLEFDITANADGSYDGQYQWEDLQEVQLASIANTCAGYFMHFDYDIETQTFVIYRKGFAFLDEDFYLGNVDATNTLSATPIASRIYTGEPSTIQEAQNVVYDGYVDYVSALYSTRRSLYNQLDQLNWRLEEAEKMRQTSVDTTMLEWAKNLVNHAYKSEEGLRNRVTDDVVDGVTVYKKVYTQTTYNAFRDAYDFANSIITAPKGQGSGLTQSMVSEAFYALLETYNALQLHLGDADWVQFLEVLGQANDLADPNGIRNDPVLGYQPDSIAALDAIISEANTFYTSNKETYDYESQEEIDSMVSRIETAILDLKYLTAPILKPNETTGGDTEIVQTATGARTFGHVIGLIEGKGITLDLVQEYGMVVNTTVGNEVSVNESTNGLGTGAYFKGTIGDIEKFRYYAVLYGDLNGDARIDGTDWSRLRYAIVTQTNGTAAGLGGDYIFEAADVNHDGFVTDDDAIIIRDYYNYAAKIVQGEHSKIEETVAL